METGLLADEPASGPRLERSKALLVIIDGLSQLAILEQRVAEIAHDARQRHDLGTQPNFGVNLAPLEAVEARIEPLEALIGLVEALIGLVKARVRLVDATGQVGPRGADLIADFDQDLGGEVSHCPGRSRRASVAQR